MSKIISIKLTAAGQKLGPFNIYDEHRNVIAENVTLKTLIAGISYEVDDSVTMITLESISGCHVSKTKSIDNITKSEYENTEFVRTFRACLWKHLTDIVHYNYFYGFIEPYVIEYPFSYSYQDEIVQSIQDYTKVFEYTKDPNGIFSDVLKVQPNYKWFNKALLYNDQQSSGLLELVPKPVHNLQQYNTYPRYNIDSKTIIYTKSDNFHQYNTFWNVVKDPLLSMFKGTCQNLSVGKQINTENMDYSTRSYRKEPLRAKYLKVRHILDNSSTIHLVSGFIISPSQNSYK